MGFDMKYKIVEMVEKGVEIRDGYYTRTIVKYKFKESDNYSLDKAFESEAEALDTLKRVVRDQREAYLEDRLFPEDTFSRKYIIVPFIEVNYEGNIEE